MPSSLWLALQIFLKYNFPSNACNRYVSVCTCMHACFRVWWKNGENFHKGTYNNNNNNVYVHIVFLSCIFRWFKINFSCAKLWHDRNVFEAFYFFHLFVRSFSFTSCGLKLKLKWDTAPAIWMLTRTRQIVFKISKTILRTWLTKIFTHLSPQNKRLLRFLIVSSTKEEFFFHKEENENSSKILIWDN
jgi:hypothetical protein